MESAESLLATCASTNQRMAVLYVDLDGFKNVNDTHGRAAGDRVLAESAQTLRATLREGDVAGRLGGDEFAACVTAAADRIEALASLIGARIVAAIGASDSGIGCSVGIAFCNGSEPHSLAIALKLADEAMHEAKRRGKGRLVISARSHLPAGKRNISDVLTGRSG